MTRWITGLALLLSLAGVSAMAEDASESEEVVSEESEAPEEAKPSWVSGRFETGIDAEWSDRDSDVDLHQSLSLRLTPPKKPNLQLRGSLWITEDLDGDESEGSLLYDIDNAYGSDIRARLLTLYLQADDVLGGAQLRVGRQRILDGPLYNRIDGLHLKWAKSKWDAYLYGGVRASLYEDAHNDLVTGAGVGYRPFASTRFGVDFFYGDEHRDPEDEVRRGPIAPLLGRRYPRRVVSELDGYLVGFNVRHRFGQHHWLHAQVLVEDDVADELQLDIAGYFPKIDVSYHFNYRQQLERVADEVNALSGYYRILGAQEAYQHVHLALQRPLNETWALALEGDWHEAENDDAFTANRDYWRAAAIVSASGLGRGIDLDLGIEWWEVTGGEGAWVLTGEVARKWESFELAFGADYEQYRNELVEYNPWPQWIRQAGVLFVPGIFAGFSPGVALLDEVRVETREEIYSAYLRGRWQFNDAQSLSGRVIYEQDDGPDAPYWRVQAAYEYEF